MSPKRSICLWLGTVDHETIVEPNAWLDYACMQSRVAYLVEPLAKLTSLDIIFTFETLYDDNDDDDEQDQRIYWRYTLNSPSNGIVCINHVLAQRLWTLFVDERFSKDENIHKRTRFYILSVLNSESVVKIANLKDWRTDHNKLLSVSDFRFLDTKKLGFLLKEQNVLFSVLTLVNSFITFLRNE